MADRVLPYVPSYGNIKKVLELIKEASTPTKFTQDHLANTLNMKGGSAKPVIPFLKRTGFLGSDGTPTELYRRFRNQAQSGAAAAEALRIGYGALYERNESIHRAKDDDLKGVIVELTGASSDSGTVKAIFGSFKALKSFADFSAPLPSNEQLDDQTDEDEDRSDFGSSLDELNLSYTINLHLPATSDIAVFHAIFQSLKTHLLR